ncbi:MAG TPA: creatininase family protein [Longimicrobiales bacterium]|nr:creatininase family protein [Longimicrobiales bacterium]
MTSYALDELSWPEVGRILARDARLLVPVGALEQHGPHLPLGTNTFISRRVTEAVSQKLRILRAPPFSYGVTVGGGPWAGTAGLRRKTFHRALNDLFARWEDHGVQEFLVVTAHRYEPHVEAILLALTARSVTTVFDLHQMDINLLLERDPTVEHAGELETSLMLHLAPHLVRSGEITDVPPQTKTLRRYIRGRVPTPPQGTRGAVGSGTLATASKGEAVFQHWVETLCATLARTGDPGPSEAGAGRKVVP